MRLKTTALGLLAVLVSCAAPVQAEFRRVELKILGMDCAICAHGIRVAVQKVEGVESVELSLERAQADIRLRPENRVVLDDFRRIVKANGFEPRQAVVTVIGAAREAQGKLQLDVAGTAQSLVVSAKSDAGAHQQIKSASAPGAAAVLEVSGVVEKASDGSESITAATVKRLR
jgi:copper chaperone CopZ